MIIKEFRVVLPLMVDEYQIGQLYAVAQASKSNTGGGEGIEVRKNEPYDNVPLLGGKFNKGQYTYKVYHLDSKVPAFIRLIAPKGSLEIHEEAWNAYPYCKTVLKNPGYMKEKFHITVETYHEADSGTTPNIHMLSPELLKQRDVVMLDIANDAVSTADYKQEEDPTLYHSKKTGRGPLVGKWQEQASPVMTCYKLVTIEFVWFGLQKKVEAFISSVYPRLFTNFHRQLFCSLDEWYGLTMDDIRELEDSTKSELDQQRKEGEVKGMTADIK